MKRNKLFACGKHVWGEVILINFNAAKIVNKHKSRASKRRVKKYLKSIGE